MLTFDGSLAWAMDELVGLANDLIEIASHEDETAAGDHIEWWLRSHTDADIERDAVGNVIARRNGSCDTTALVGHHDVVPPATAQVDATGTPVATVDEGRLYGRGAADMKGAVAAMLLAFRDAETDDPIAFASFVAEEVGGDGARHAVAEGFVPARAIVGEGSAAYATDGALDVVVAHRGRRGSTLHAEGDACHASEPAQGVNAIYRATAALDRVRALEAPTATVAGETLAGSLAATGIEAGTADNVVPGACTVTLDERLVPGAHLDIEGAIEDITGVTRTIDQDWPPMRCHDGAFAESVREVASATQGVEVATTTKPHATDASWLADAGTATVVLGPAEQGEAHTDDESVSIELLDTACSVYRHALERAG